MAIFDVPEVLLSLPSLGPSDRTATLSDHPINMNLSVPIFEPTSFIFLGECVTYQLGQSVCTWHV